MKTKSFPLHLASCVLCLFALCPAPRALSQIPQGFNYQAIVRDGVTGNPITDPIDVKIAILCVWNGARIFRSAIIMQGKRPKIGTLIRYIIKG